MSRWTRNKTTADDWDTQGQLWGFARRLKHVQIEQDDALAVIPRYDTTQTLFYVDPPYLSATRGRRWRRSAYLHEYTEEQHRLLASALHRVRGMVVLSGYFSELYDQLYGDWSLYRRVAHKDNGTQREAVECLWLSPNVKAWQLSLFGELEGGEAFA